MGRAPCCEKEGLKRGPWTYAEDVRLIQYIQIHGEGSWRALPKAAGLLRCGKSCRLRWFNYLRPDLKRGKITEDEESLIIKLHSLLGNRWSLISGRLPGRTDNEIKNHWNAHLKKRLRAMGINPETHQPLDRQLNCEPIGITDETMMQENTSAFNSSTTKAMARVQFKGIDATERIAMEKPNQTFSPVNISLQAKVCKEDITNLIHAESFCASPDSATTQMHTLTDSSTYLPFDRPTAAREEEMMDVYSSHSMTKDEEFWSVLESELIWEMEMRHAVAIAIPIGSPTGNLDAGASADLWGAGDMVAEANPDPPWLNWESY